MFPIWIHTKEEVKRLLILGAGGFGHMIQETARLLGYEEVVFLDDAVKGADVIGKCPVSYTHLTLPTIYPKCRSRWSPYH